MGERVLAGSRLPQHATVFIKEPPQFTEEGNVFHAIYGSGDAVFSVAFTPHTLHNGIVLAQAALAQWRVRQLDVVKPIRKKAR